MPDQVFLSRTGFRKISALAGFVPYTGATASLDLGTHSVTAAHFIGEWNGDIIPVTLGGTGLSTVAFGDILWGSATDTLSALSGNTTATPLVLTSIGDGTGNVSLSWQPLPEPGARTYYWTNTASDVATYYNQTTAVFTGSATISTPSVTNGQLLATFITLPGFPNVDIIPDGVYISHIHAAKTSGTKAAQIYVEIWETTSAGIDIGVIATLGPSTVLSGSPAEFQVATSSSTAYVMASASSRVATKVFATVTGGGSAPTIALYASTTNDSRTTIPAPTVDASNFVPYSGATASLNMGAFNVTATTFIGALNGNADTVTTINGKISAGTNITLSGSGTTVSPYVINSTGGGGSSNSDYNNNFLLGGM